MGGGLRPAGGVATIIPPSFLIPAGNSPISHWERVGFSLGIGAFSSEKSSWEVIPLHCDGQSLPGGRKFPRNNPSPQVRRQINDVAGVVQGAASQFELAERAELSEQTINSIESRRLWPSDKTLIKICGVFNIDVYQLFLPEILLLIYSSQDYTELKSAVVESIRHLVSRTLDEILKEG